LTTQLARRALAGGISLAVAATTAAALSQTPAAAAPAASAASPGQDSANRRDNLPNPLAKKQNRLRKQAIELLVNGKAESEPQRGGGSVVTLANGESVELFGVRRRVVRPVRPR